MIDHARKKSFVSDLGGSIFIFDTEDSKPIMVLQLPSSLKRIRGMCLDSLECLLFAVGRDDGNICVYDIEKPGKVFIKCV